MIEIVEIRCSLSRSGRDASLKDDLARAYSEGFTQTLTFKAEFKRDDSRLFEILRILDRGGRQLDIEHYRGDLAESNLYRLRVRREYDEADCAECEFLKLIPKDVKYFSGAGRDEASGLLVIDVECLDKRHDLAVGAPRQFIVSNRFAQLLGSSGLEGIILRPTVLLHREGHQGNPKAPRPEWEDYGLSPWYELTAEVELPPAIKGRGESAPDFRRIDLRSGTIEFQGLRNGNVETHYLTSDVAKFPKFDLARCFERDEMEYARMDRMLIASKRFYQFCRKHKVNAMWVPVRIDPD